MSLSPPLGQQLRFPLVVACPVVGKSVFLREVYVWKLSSFRGRKVQLTGTYIGGSCPLIVTLKGGVLYGEDVHGETSWILSRFTANHIEK